MGFPGGGAFFAGELRLFFGDPAAQLIIDTQEYLRILPVVGKGDDIQNVCDDPVGKECVVRLAAAIGYPAPVQQVDQRQDTVVVAVQDGDLSVGVRRRENEPRVLGGARSAARTRCTPAPEALVGRMVLGRRSWFRRINASAVRRISGVER